MPTRYDFGNILPSDKRIDLTLSASGSTYTAPANGWFSWSGIATATNGYIKMITVNNGIGLETTQPVKDRGICGHIQIKKGETASLQYNAASFEYFRFIYAEGQPSIIKF